MDSGSRKCHQYLYHGIISDNMYFTWNLHPSAQYSELNHHLGCRSFTSATRVFQRWFKPASLSFRKLASGGRSLCTMPSPVWFIAIRLGWWLLMPSSSSYDRLHTMNFHHLIQLIRYLNKCTQYCSINLRAPETNSWEGFYVRENVFSNRLITFPGTHGNESYLEIEPILMNVTRQNILT